MRADGRSGSFDLSGLRTTGWPEPDEVIFEMIGRLTGMERKSKWEPESARASRLGG